MAESAAGGGGGNGGGGGGGSAAGGAGEAAGPIEGGARALGSSAALPPARILLWDDLTPYGDRPLAGSQGVVVRALYAPPRGIRRAVAVKVLKAAIMDEADRAAVTSTLAEEARITAAALEQGSNAYVAVVIGVVSGVAGGDWEAVLGNFAPLCRAGAASPLHGLVLQWEEGGTLEDLLHAPGRAWGASTASKLQLCARIASGLAYLHLNSAGEIIHGDLKPANILLSSRGDDPLPKVSDFGLSVLREPWITRHLCATCVVGGGDKRGSWPYMAMELLDGARVSRSSDIFALGTLMWETLSGSLPWRDYRDTSRVCALFRGETLPIASPPLPVDLPESMRTLLARCMAFDTTQRPRVSEVADSLHQAAQAMAAGEFDIFLSHKWAGKEHSLLATQVYRGLLEAGYRVWLDSKEMGYDMPVSMERGIARSRCVVALLNAGYEGSVNCLKELQWAVDKDKPILACLADPSPEWMPSEHVAGLVGMRSHLLVDLRAAAALHVDAESPEWSLLTRCETALPLMLRFMKERLGAAAR